jgi:hypothetical protein
MDKSKVVNEEMQPLIRQLAEIARREGINLVCVAQVDEGRVMSTAIIDSDRMRPCPAIRACGMVVKASMEGVPLDVLAVELRADERTECDCPSCRARREAAPAAATRLPFAPEAHA